jgi:hypothetical protein
MWGVIAMEYCRRIAKGKQHQRIEARHWDMPITAIPY